MGTQKLGDEVMAVIGVLALLVAVAGAYFGVAADQDFWPFHPDETRDEPPQALVNIEILLDHSSAMGQLFDGDTKLVAAISAVEKVLGARVATTDNLAFRQFGGPCAGENTDLLVPFGQKNKDKVRDALEVIEGKQPTGATMLAHAILEATGDFNILGSFEGKKLSLIVITGGVDTCDADYEEHIKDRLEGFPITLEALPKRSGFWIISLDLPSEQAERLQRIAQEVGAQARNVQNRGQLDTALEEWRKDIDAPPGSTATPVPTPTAAATPPTTETPTQLPPPTRTLTPLPTPTNTPTRTPPPTNTPIPRPTPTYIPTPSLMPPCNLIEQPSEPQIKLNPKVPPHVFIGKATTHEGPASEGSEVTAWVEGYIVGSTTVSDRRYTILVFQPLDWSIDGKKILFKIGDFVADQTGTWEQGGGGEKDLTARSECEQPR